MRKILFAIFILFGMVINLYAIWPTDEVISDIFSPDVHAIFVIAMPTNTYDVHGSTIYITQSQLNSLLASIEASSKAITQGLTDVKFEVHATSDGIVIALASVSQNIIASSNAVVQALHDVGVQIVESSNAVTNKLTGIQNILNAGTTIFNSNPQMLYPGQTVYKSSGTAGHITGVTGVTITISDKVTDFYFLYESPSDELCKIEPSTWGVPISLGDGKFCNVIERYPEAITFTVSNMVVGSSLTWVTPTCK